jgi:hypothetical protein
MRVCVNVVGNMVTTNTGTIGYCASLDNWQSGIFGQRHKLLLQAKLPVRPNPHESVQRYWQGSYRNTLMVTQGSNVQSDFVLHFLPRTSCSQTYIDGHACAAIQ